MIFGVLTGFFVRFPHFLVCVFCVYICGMWSYILHQFKTGFYVVCDHIMNEFKTGFFSIRYGIEWPGSGRREAIDVPPTRCSGRARVFHFFGSRQIGQTLTIPYARQTIPTGAALISKTCCIICPFISSKTLLILCSNLVSSSGLYDGNPSIGFWPCILDWVNPSIGF